MLEVHRVLKPGGSFLLADLVALSEVPAELEKNILAFTGCFNGISRLERYLQFLKMAGFHPIEVMDQRPVQLPASLFPENQSLLNAFQANGLVAACLLATKKSG
jgi:hypothetical protein